MLIKFSIIIPANIVELFSDALLENEALSISLEDPKDQKIFQLQPGEHPLWPTVKLSALFSENIQKEKIINLAQLFVTDIHTANFTPVEEKDWVRLTQKDFPAQRFGKDLWVCPSWQDETQLSGTILKLDPGVAFGTGTHPTTSLCLEWLSQNAPLNKEVIDYGCGSGILALAALALGAQKVWAVDHDPQALEATLDNATKNNFNSQQLEILLPEKLPPLKADLILANILSTPLLELAPTFHSLLKKEGQIILSGILTTEIDQILQTYQKYFHLEEQRTTQEWALLNLKLL